MLIAAPIEAVTANIGGGIIYGALNIDDHLQKQLMTKDPWQNYLALIIDEINMVFLKYYL